MNRSQIFNAAHTIAKNKMNMKMFAGEFSSYREAFAYGLKMAYANANPEASIIKEIANNKDSIVTREKASESAIGVYLLRLEDDKIKIEVNLFNQTAQISRSYGREMMMVSLSKVSQFISL